MMEAILCLVMRLLFELRRVFEVVPFDGLRIFEVIGFCFGGC